MTRHISIDLLALAKQVNFYKAQQVNCNLVSKDKFYSHDWHHTEYSNQELKYVDIPQSKSLKFLQNYIIFLAVSYFVQSSKYRISAAN